MAGALPALSTTRLKMRFGPAGTSATTSSASLAKGRETYPLHRKTPWLCWVRRKRGPRSRVVLAWARGPASQDGKPRKTISRPSKGAFRDLVVVRAAQLSRVIARHPNEAFGCTPLSVVNRSACPPWLHASGDDVEVGLPALVACLWGRRRRLASPL